ncbi:MBOAT family O-acyltransferase [Dyadobacter crusticola]|uniref:MBOAT family O-acyltransferase n=1 Tax=Dyadobacter crusticola TaxID=292407 RepID=UPI0004E176DD|nr:MBOAT family O-acyltransferase [Dyadobacter crusticola]
MDLYSAEHLGIILPIEVILFYILPIRFRNYWLAFVSLAFLSTYNLASALVAIAVTLVILICSRLLVLSKEASAKYWLSTGIALVLALLILSRQGSDRIFGVQYSWVGISYYSLMAIAYLIEVKVGRLKILPTFHNLLLYITFFPQLLAGPIDNSLKLLIQLKDGVNFSRHRTWIAVKHMIYGLFCKLVLADRLSEIVEPVFDGNEKIEALNLFLGSIGFSMQIYFDFLGYTYLVIGIAMLFGLNLTQNFNKPYAASNTKDFWKRWHISLTEWFRRYIFIPFGGNRDKKRLPVLIVFVFILSGFWHGFSWNFLVWACMHSFHYLIGIYMMSHSETATNGFSKMIAFLKWVAFLLWINLTWIVFRTHDLRTLVSRLAFKLTTEVTLTYSVLLLTAALAFLVIDHKGIPSRIASSNAHKGRLLWAEVVFIDFLLLGLFLLGGIGTKQFLYFKF